jgi:hypothetical protein
MRKIVLLALVVVCALAIVHAFFMPWAKASASAGKVASDSLAGVEKKYPLLSGLFGNMSKESEKVTSAADAVTVKMSVSGYDIPKMMNAKSSQVAVALTGIFMKDAKDADKKSYAVYLMPILALVCIGLAFMGMKNKIALIVMAVLSGGIAGGGLYNLMTVNLSNLPIQISIERGLWQTMYAYLMIFIIGIVWIALDMKEAKK